MPALGSLRVRGLAGKLYLGVRKPPQRPPPPLRVKGGVRLESMCAGDIPRFMVYTRARHSKAQHLCTPVFDLDSRGNLPAGFIDAEVKNRMTSYTVERKTKFLPTLAPVRGLGGKCWAPGWKAALEKEGISAGVGKPLCIHLRVVGDGMRFFSRLRLLVSG